VAAVAVVVNKMGGSKCPSDSFLLRTRTKLDYATVQQK
jgi:hypothetical protein